MNSKGGNVIPTERALRPTAAGDRALQLDVLRGLALFGVLLVNLDLFSGAEWALEARLPYPWGWGGQTLSFLRHALLETKAAALLAMLFGAGLTIQRDANAARGSYWAFALRRVAALAALGLAHTFLLWNGDILFDYALISLMVLPFLGLRAARILWAIPVVLLASGLIAALVMLAPAPPSAAWLYAAGLRHYGAASWLEALKFRSWESVYVLGPMRLANRLVTLAPFFILGVFFWKRGVLSKPEHHTRALRLLFGVCFGLGLMSNVVPRETLHTWVNHAISLQPLRVLIKALHFFSQPAATLAYFAGVLLLIQRAWWRRVLGLFAPLGRMTLSQYLLQSVVCTWIFNGYGLGLYGKVPMNACLLGGTVFFAVQVWSSHVWLAHYRMGPAEWLWRRVTYATPQAFRLKPAATSSASVHARATPTDLGATTSVVEP